MNYNLLLDTNFQTLDTQSTWKLTNCRYDNGYLIGESKIYSIEQTLTIPTTTKIYFGLDYICLDPNISNVLIGIQSKHILEANRKTPKTHKRKRISIINDVKDTIKLIFIIESKVENSRIYIDSPLLVDLNYLGKSCWARWALNKSLVFRQGYCYKNIYKQNELSLDNPDFQSSYLINKKATTGIISTLNGNRALLTIQAPLNPGSYYLVKLEYEEINNYGQTYLKYGEFLSEPLGNTQLYLIFRANSHNSLELMIENEEELKYSINLRHLLIINIDKLNIDVGDIPHIPFIDN